MRPDQFMEGPRTTLQEMGGGVSDRAFWLGPEHVRPSMANTVATEPNAARPAAALSHEPKIAVGTALSSFWVRAAPRTDPDWRCYLIRFLPWIWRQTALRAKGGTIARGEASDL